MTQEFGAGPPDPAGPEFRFGEGRISGVISLALGGLSLLAVLCFRFPALLTTPDLRAVYPMDLVRAVLMAALLLALALGLVSTVLQRRFGLGLAGIALAAVAILLGGAWVPAEGPVVQRSYAGLDWFVLDLLVLAAIFVPLERIFVRLPEQRIFRSGWRTDLAHFFVSHLLVQVTVMLTMAPAALLFGRFVDAGFQHAVAAQPAALQFVEALFLADLFQYGAHRAFHRFPRLWAFHAIHHSSTEMDWLAGSRLHLVDIVLTRAASFLPLFVMGFAEGPLLAYLVFVAAQATFIHANVRLRWRPLRWLIATPAYHHWHHAAEPEAVDKNFAVHLPLLDLVFGTAYLPGRWPARYGLLGAAPPSGYVGQLVEPFREAFGPSSRLGSGGKPP